MFPPELHLEGRQIIAVRKWVRELGLPTLDTEESVTPTSLITWTLYTTGLGTEISASIYDPRVRGYRRLSVSIDDNNELHPTETIKRICP